MQRARAASPAKQCVSFAFFAFLCIQAALLGPTVQATDGLQTAESIVHLVLRLRQERASHSVASRKSVPDAPKAKQMSHGTAVRQSALRQRSVSVCRGVGAAASVFCSHAPHRCKCRPKIIPVSCDIHAHTHAPKGSTNFIHTLPICFNNMFYRQSWAWAWI